MSQSGSFILAVGPCRAAIPDPTICSRRGVRLIHVTSRQDALLWVREAQPDIVLVDAEMADADPEGLVRQCQRLSPSARVILIEPEIAPLNAA